ncbi:MAG: hypothetical protein KZQ92_00390 [Candidatus Thiodiazotropha sp. (ex Lucinoma borealis)]|nr:hypothetical protein [Candidatus Thiodiazotropha sp. (ex Lucinoma borealis)]
MARTTQDARTLTQIFETAKICGAENVLCNDTETGIVLAGSDANTLEPGTIANKRSRGELNIPFYKAGREPRYRLSDLIAYRNKHMRSVA